MPLTKKGTKLLRKFKGEYGAKKGEQVFYASENKGTIAGVKKGYLRAMKKLKSRKK
ncbi:MAG: hypothetical protein UT51_C0011G0006 [Candidatus Nomurabacteria bacterium GW2011_GWC2_39_41]|uniref:Uncharacterized protein n=2 Tax=Parcubacteria group TaxID=1794811 RepID=A0A0G1PP53_9BACT|nr:MAG: hypothetical protein UT51_C0011G0006 [Candidatus Nomurabacteria bacterium GW2011_GWC2_39_41]KKU34559.1 MAG: hypothetical protein UX48_C0031G0007 [Candidatus Azambacteria bacterium GW2011_GWB1_46_27]